jgi:hypothetical protein
MHFLLLLTSLAMADEYIPWFDQAAAEDRVAQAMPDYFVALENMREAHPERYLERLNRALGLTAQAAAYPQLLEVWNRKWSAEMSFRYTVQDWQRADEDDKAAIRGQLEEMAAEIYAADLALLEIKQRMIEDRLARFDGHLLDAELALGTPPEQRLAELDAE